MCPGYTQTDRQTDNITSSANTGGEYMKRNHVCTLVKLQCTGSIRGFNRERFSGICSAENLGHMHCREIPWYLPDLDLRVLCQPTIMAMHSNEILAIHRAQTLFIFVGTGPFLPNISIFGFHSTPGFQQFFLCGTLHLRIGYNREIEVKWHSP